jgi:hypothetical protein
MKIVGLLAFLIRNGTCLHRLTLLTSGRISQIAARNRETASNIATARKGSQPVRQPQTFSAGIGFD